MDLITLEKEKLENKYKELCKEEYPGRLGKTFKTKYNFYYYDSGTGKVAQINKNVYKVLTKFLESENFLDFIKLDMSEQEFCEAISEIKDAINKESILSATKFNCLTGKTYEQIDEIIDNKIQNVTLEVTEKCNLRCKYCIYNESHPEYRAFGHKNMDWEVAKKAVDFLKAHSQNSDERHIGFYGGEPLINYDLIKKTTDYANKLFDKMTYSMTTNATLMNEEIADYIMKNKFNIIVSLDGYKELHNKNRLFVSGEGSFEKTINGLKILLRSAEKYNNKENITLNMVIEGPDYEDKYDKIQVYLNECDWLPKNINILTSSIDYGPHESIYTRPQSYEERMILKDYYDPILSWDEKNKIRNKDNTNEIFTDADVDKAMMIIHKRLLSEKPVKKYGMNGCCVPGERRIYVTVDGNFKICEKVGDIPEIGNVHKGFDEKRIKELYFDDFIKESSKYCKDCWAINLCTLCYVNCYDQYGTHFSYRHNSCRSERKYLLDSLIKYHEILEENPDVLKEFNEIEFQ